MCDAEVRRVHMEMTDVSQCVCVHYNLITHNDLLEQIQKREVKTREKRDNHQSAELNVQIIKHSEL